MLIECSERAGSELFIVEGKHAANAVKRVRDRRTQAILALQGKLPNAARGKSQAKLLANPQINELLSAIDDSRSADFQLSGMRYSKIIILTDPDADGVHARVLLANLFYFQLRSIVEQGLVHMVNAPLFCIKGTQLDEPLYVYSVKQYKDVTEKLEAAGIRDTDVTRFKGLASLNSDELRICIDPRSRAIQQLTLSDCTAMSLLF